MEREAVERLRNVALIGHGGSGKTQLAEAMLWMAGVSDRFGKVDDGNTVMDFDPEEIERRISIQTACASVPWRDHKINLLDTPGYFDFVGEVRAALRVAEAAVIVCDAVAGVEVGTEMVWRYAGEYDLPRLVFVNKMERENADFDKVLEQLRRTFGKPVTPLQLPVGAEADFRGVVDLLAGKAYAFSDGQPAETEIPEQLSSRVEELRTSLVEDIAESDDALLEKYLEGGTLSAEELVRGFREAVRRGHVVPVLCGSGLANVGVTALLDAAVDLLPSPTARPAAVGTEPPGNGETQREASPDQPFSALVFKTLADPYVGKMSLFKVYSGSLRSDGNAHNANRNANERVGQLFAPRGKDQESVKEVAAGDITGVAKLQETGTGDTLCDGSALIQYPAIDFPDPVFSVAVEPKSKGDEEKISNGLARLAEEDPTFRVERNRETRQTLLYGMGEMHLDVITVRLKRKFGVEVEMTTPRVPYRETVRTRATSEHKHKKQTGGRGQYGHVLLRLEPRERGTGFEFDEEIFGGAVPRQYIPAVEKGVRETLAEGVMAGYPVTDVKVVLYDGSYHSVDSSEMAFKVAGSQAFKKAFRGAKPVLLEPIVDVEVYIPEEYMGDIMGDLNKRRGRIQGMDQQGTAQVIRARVPQAEMFTYAIDLRSMTQGRGVYTLRFSHYEEVPDPVARQVIEAAQAPA